MGLTRGYIDFDYAVLVTNYIIMPDCAIINLCRHNVLVATAIATRQIHSLNVGRINKHADFDSDSDLRTCSRTPCYRHNHPRSSHGAVNPGVSCDCSHSL